LATRIANFLRNLPDTVLVQVSKTNGGSLLGPVLSDCRSHALGGAGNECFSPGKTFSVHNFSLLVELHCGYYMVWVG
jgi:hypothetical protein